MESDPAAAAGTAARSVTVRSRFSPGTKRRVDEYAAAERMTLSAAIEELVEKGLENGTTPSEMDAILNDRLDSFLSDATRLL